MARVGLVLSLAGGFMMLAGSFMTWADFRVIAIAGTDEPAGQITAFMGGVIMVVGWTRYSNTSPSFRVVTAVVSVVASAVALYTLWYVALSPGQGIYGEVGDGIKLVAAGSVVALVGAFFPGRMPASPVDEGAPADLRSPVQRLLDSGKDEEA